MPRKRKPGRPRNPGRPITTGKYAAKISPEIKDIKRLVLKAERAWAKKKPKSQKEFQELMSTCGQGCFLDGGLSQTNEYAICKKCSKKECYCYPDCDGLFHVKRKANLDGITTIEQAAQYLTERLGCEWDTAVKMLLSEKYPNTLQLL